MRRASIVMDYRLPDLIDIPSLDDLLESFHAVTGITCGVMDDTGRWLSRHGLQDICTRHHLPHPVAGERCLASDQEARRRLALGEPFTHACANGLLYLAVPIRVEGRVLGGMFMSQFLQRPPDREAFRAAARDLGLDEADYLACLDRVPVFGRERAEAIKTYCTRLVAQLTDMGLQRLRLSRADDSQRRQLHLFETLLDAFPSPAFHKGLDGRYRGCNKAFCEALGLDPANVVGHAARDILPPVHAAVIEAKDRELAARPGTQTYETCLRTTSGRVLDAIATRAVYRDSRGRPDGIVGVYVDITRRKQVEQALDAAEGNYRRIFENAVHGIFQSDPGGRFIRVNPALVRMFGYDSAPEMIVSVTDIVHQCYAEPERREDFLDALRREGSVRQFKVRMLRRDGSTFWASITAKAIIGPEGIAYIDGFVEDVTDLVAAREEARDREQQLIQADKMISLGILTAGVGHEINNPNNYIMLNAPILKEAWEDIRPVLDAHARDEGDYLLAGIPFSEMRATVPSLLDGIVQGSERIARIVRSMKDFARQDSQDMDRAVDLHAVLDSSLTLLAARLRKSTAGVVQRRADGLPALRGNAQRLEQVLVNLLLNAAEATADDSLPIEVTTSVEHGAVRLTVRDHGCGIDPDDLPRILDPFFTTKRDMGGVGLGLSISSSIVKAHGGDLRFEPPPGGGAAAVVSLPVPKNPPGRS